MTRWGGRASRALAQRVYWQHGTVCHLCGGEGADSVDHLIPRSRGGADTLDNLRPAHLSCNQRKGARLPPPVGPPVHRGRWS